jgi:hypothetical protein
LQLAIQQEEYKRFINLNKKIKDDTTKEAEEQEAKWRSHVSKESAAWAERFERETELFQTATNQTIQNHEAMNAHLKQENELIKARCDSQERQQKLMQKQIAELNAVQNQNADCNKVLEPPMEYDQQRDKRDTPTTPTEMTNSPTSIQKTKKMTLLHKTFSKPY